ncbi:MAG: YdcF family protein [Pseudomonadota bacterium]
MPSSIGIIVSLLTASAIWCFIQPSKRARTLAILTLTGFSVVYWTPLAAWLVWPLETAFPTFSTQSHLESPIIIHLSGAERATRTANNHTVMLNDQHGRYFEVMRLLAAFPDATVLFAVGLEREHTSDAAMAMEIYRRAGLSERVTFIGNAKNTYENGRDVAAYIAKEAILQPIILVTSAAHMPRALLSFQAYDIEVIPAPAPPLTRKVTFWKSWTAYGGRIENLTVFQRAIHEWGGLAVYRLKGRTQRFWPKRE